MGEIFVKVAKLGTSVKELFMENSTATVGDALSKADYDSKGYDVRVNGVRADSSRRLAANDTITLVPQVKGGR